MIDTKKEGVLGNPMEILVGITILIYVVFIPWGVNGAKEQFYRLGVIALIVYNARLAFEFMLNNEKKQWER